jgi:hypothetical protein
MDNISNKEMNILQAGASVVGGIVATTAKMCGSLNAVSNGELSRAAGLRGGCTVMLPGLLAMASLIGLNKEGRLCINTDNGDRPQDFCNETAVLFCSLLMSNMAGEIVSRSRDEVLLAVEFGSAVLAKALEGTEKICGPADGKIDPTLLSAARETISTGNKALDMLNRLVAAGQAH